MRCVLKSMGLLLVLGWLISYTHSGAEAQSAEQPRPSGPAQAKQNSDVLNKYSLSELQQIITNRSNKALYSNESVETRNIPTAEVANNIIFRQKTLYGFDDRRKDYFEIQDPEILKVADSVASVIPVKYIKLDSNSITITGQPLGQRFSLCRQEAYYDEPSAADCTAFVVGPDLVATAGHCTESIGSSRIVFGYRELKDSAGVHPQVVIPNSQVYRVLQVVAQKYDPVGIDFAILRLDRQIKDHAPLQLENSEQPEKGLLVYVLGHPSGLPLKLADNATIQNVSSNGYFTANLDTFGGNSGSPVLGSGTNHVRGILVRGGTDYRPQGTCNIAYVCPAVPDSTAECGGEAVTLISAVGKQLASMPNDKSIPPRPPLLKTYASGPVISGSGASFSQEYQVVSDPTPAGYKIGGFTYSLTGDRGCNAWSTCKAAIEGDRVVFRFTLQGHNEWPSPGQAISQGFLNVKFVPNR